MTKISTGILAGIVYPDGKTESVRVDGQLDTLQGIVGGPIEFIHVAPGVHAYCNEEGKFDGSLPNHVATIMTGLAGRDIVMGTVIFLGDGEDGEEGDLPENWTATFGYPAEDA